MRVELHCIKKSFGKTQVLMEAKGVIPSGALFCLIGSNGAGKTTLLNLLSTIYSPSSGEIFYDGQLLSREAISLRKKFFFLPGIPVVNALWTPLKFASLAASVYAINDGNYVESCLNHWQTLECLHLAETKFSSMSRGEVYKMVLSIMVALNLPLWLLDEPFASGMDPAGISFFKAKAREAILRGATVIYSTQLLVLAEDFSDHLGILHKGRLHIKQTAALRENAGESEGIQKDEWNKLLQSLRVH